MFRYRASNADIDLNSDKEDSRSIFITIHGRSSTTSGESKPLLSSKFIFDDHIRCMAAKQRLTKGRQKARQYKLDLVKQILEIKPSSAHSSRSSTPLLPLFKSGGAKNVPGHAVLSSSKNTTEPSRYPHNRQSGEPSTQNFTPYESRMIPKTCNSRTSEYGYENDIQSRRNVARRVRVLSSNALERLSNDFENSTIVTAQETDQFDRHQAEIPLQREILTTHNKRCNSLSPRFFARNSFTPDQNSLLPDRAQKNHRVFVGSTTTNDCIILSSNLAIGQTAKIEDDNPCESFSANASNPSIQCFNNATRNKSTKFLVHHI
uniref:CLEC16A/TT9 C-terminal domain-containing protein n=1 Tax=Romanomermis culicivorax TaxID=13658 RepID=A0A915HL61_ROMCU